MTLEQRLAEVEARQEILLAEQAALIRRLDRAEGVIRPGSPEALTAMQEVEVRMLAQEVHQSIMRGTRRRRVG